MQLPQRSDRAVEESKNPLNAGSREGPSSHSWGFPSFSSKTAHDIKLKRSNHVEQDRRSFTGRLSLQGLSGSPMLIDGTVSLNKDKDCEKDTTFLLQSYSVYFDCNIFLKELVVNTCFPFTSWVDPYMHSFNNYSSRLSIFLVMVLPILLALLIVSNVISDISNSEMTLPVSMFILHKVAVALKYASLHPCEYKKLQDARDHDTVGRYQGSLQMLSSWLGQDLRVMEHEIKAAAAVSGADIDHTMIILPTDGEEAKFTMSASETSHHHTWRSFLSKNDCNIDSLPKNNAGNHMLSVHEFTRVLLNEANTRNYGRRLFTRLIRVLILILTFLPFMLRGFVHSGKMQDWAYFHDVLSIIFCPIMINVNLLLIFCPIFDVSRRKKLAKLLNFITTVSTIRAEQKSELPIIDMFKAQNVYGWMYTRLVIQSFGKRMLARIDNFMSTYSIVCAFVTIYLIASLFADPVSLEESYVHQLFLLILIVLSMICAQVYLASQVNDEFAQHRVNVVLNEMKANSRWLYLVELQDEMMTRDEQHTEKFKMVETEKFRLEEAMKAMKRVIEAITISNEQNPLCVLGMKADMSILISILTAIATLISSIITVALRQ